MDINTQCASTHMHIYICIHTYTHMYICVWPIVNYVVKISQCHKKLHTAETEAVGKNYRTLGIISHCARWDTIMNIKDGFAYIH